MRDKMRNKKGGFSLANTIILCGIGLLYLVTIFTFKSSDVFVKTSFVGIAKVENLNALIEENYFYEKNLISSDISPNMQNGQPDENNLENKNSNAALINAIEYTQKNSPIVNRRFKCEDRCGEYAKLIEINSKKYNVDPILILSLIMQESDGVASAGSSSSFGLMQINGDNCGSYGLPSNLEECKNVLKNDVNKNIEVGLTILNEKYNNFKEGKIFQGCSNRNVLYEGWEAALRGYNGWGCGCNLLIRAVLPQDKCSVFNKKTEKTLYGMKVYAQDNYVEEVIRRYGILKGTYQENLVIRKNLFEKKEEIDFSVKYLGEPK